MTISTVFVKQVLRNPLQYTMTQWYHTWVNMYDSLTMTINSTLIVICGKVRKAQQMDIYRSLTKEELWVPWLFTVCLVSMLFYSPSRLCRLFGLFEGSVFDLVVVLDFMKAYRCQTLPNHFNNNLDFIVGLQLYATRTHKMPQVHFREQRHHVPIANTFIRSRSWKKQTQSWCVSGMYPPPLGGMNKTQTLTKMVSTPFIHIYRSTIRSKLGPIMYAMFLL